MLHVCRALIGAALLSTSLLALGVPARAQDDESEAPAEAEFVIPDPPRGISCVYMPRPRDYTVIDRKHLVLEASRRDLVLVTLDRNCSALATTFTLGLDRSGSQLCTTDAIITDGDRCTIKSVEEIDSLEHGKAIVAARTAEKSRDDDDEAGDD